MCLLFIYVFFPPSYELVKFESISGQSQKETALLPKTGNVSNMPFSNIFCIGLSRY